MYAYDLIKYLSKTDENRKRAYSEDEVRYMADISHEECAEDLEKLFCYEKAMHDPSPKVRKTQERMRKHGAEESFIAEMTTYLQWTEFDFPLILQEAIRDAIFQMDNQSKRENPEYNTIEWWFEANCM